MTAPKAGDRVRVTFEAVYKSASPISGGHWIDVGRLCVVPLDATIKVLGPSWETAKGSVIRFGGDVYRTYTCYGGDNWRRHGGATRCFLTNLRADYGEPTVLYDASKS